jgi:hypothetical protein
MRNPEKIAAEISNMKESIQEGEGKKKYRKEEYMRAPE